MDTGPEESVGDAYCVVYRLSASNSWVVIGEGWAQIHLYRDNTDNSYRIVGWTVVDCEVVINCMVSPLCQYKKKSDDFHKFVDEDKKTYGFGFYKKDDSYADSHKFADLVMNVIRPNRAPPRPPNARRPANTSNTSSKPPAPAGPSLSQSSSSLPQPSVPSSAPHLTLGELKIQAPKAARTQLISTNSKAEITDPTRVTHDQHVRYDAKSRSYVGLPPEWQQQLNKQFGVPLDQIEKAPLEKYPSGIPAVLIQLKEHWDKMEGKNTVGIFRIAPDAEESSFVKQQLNENSFMGCSDVHVISNLMKVYFRDLPVGLLDIVDRNLIGTCKSPSQVQRIIDTMASKPVHRDTFLWLLDICVEVSELQQVNKMTAKNLAIVIGPNLYKPSLQDPMASLRFSQKLADFLQQCIEWRSSNLDYASV